MDEMYRNRVETLEGFRSRTAWKDGPLGEIRVPEDQDKKVRADGSFACLVGDTVLYELDGSVRFCLDGMRKALYREFGDILCMPLPMESLHLTLHDLCAMPPEKRGEAAAAAAKHEKQVEELLMQFRVIYPDTIRLRPTKIVSMVSRSIVLLLEPETDEDCKALTDMYRRLDAVVPLNYPFTPHITLAYFKPQFSHDIVDFEAATKYARTLIRLEQAFGAIFREHPLASVELRLHRLVHRCFTDMANYMRRDVFAANLACTDEEMAAHQEFCNMQLMARGLLDRGVPYHEVLWSMAGHEMNLDMEAKKSKLHRCCKNFPYSLYDDLHGDLRDISQDALGETLSGLMRYRLLCAVIILNLYDRGLLTADVEVRVEWTLLHHCFHNLHWDC